MFVKRLISGIFLLAAAVVLFAVGGPALLLVLAAISIVGQNEFYHAVDMKHDVLRHLGYAMTVIYYLMVFFEGRKYIAGMIVGTLLVLLIVYVASYPRYRIEDISIAFFGVCYVSVMMSYIYLTRHYLDGKYYVWLILLCSWGCDTLAYCTGMLIGKHKMTPLLSPKKTWEGAFGGAIGAALLGLIYGLILGSRMNDTVKPAVTCAIACFIGAIISMIGDLAASGVKRNHNVKDYGHLIPGHGGILDRFDSMLFTAPAVYYAIYLLEDWVYIK